MPPTSTPSTASVYFVFICDSSPGRTVHLLARGPGSFEHEAKEVKLITLLFDGQVLGESQGGGWESPGPVKSAGRRSTGVRRTNCQISLALSVFPEASRPSSENLGRLRRT